MSIQSINMIKNYLDQHQYKVYGNICYLNQRKKGFKGFVTVYIKEKKNRIGTDILERTGDFEY